MQTDTPYAAQLEAKLKAMALSPAAAHWVSKALHPVIGAPANIPDAIQVASVLPEYKTTTVISAPSGLPANTNWDCCIVLPPSDTQAAYVSTGAAGIDFATTLGLSTTNVVNATCSYATIAGLTASATKITDGTQFAPLQMYACYSDEHPATWRTSSRSATVYATGSDLYNQGTVYGGQFARQAQPITGQEFGFATGKFSICGMNAVSLPLREADMALQTPNLYTTSAREGVYTVHRLTGPAQEFVRRRGFGTGRNIDQTYGLVDISDGTAYSNLTLEGVRFMQDDPSQVSPVFPMPNASWLSSGFDQNCSWGVLIFRGLHPLMTLTLKTVTVLELVPEAAAPARQFVRPPGKYEPTAMAAYYALASEVPTTMAAKYNFLSALMPVLSSVATKVLPFLAPAAKTLLGTIGSSIGSFLGGQEERAAPPARQGVMLPPPTPRMIRSRSARSASSVRSGVKVRLRPTARVKIARRKRR